MKPIPIDIRLICATNVPLAELANENRFPERSYLPDQYGGDNGATLRKRGNDIILLARHFAKLYSNKYMKTTPDFDKKAMEKLLSYHYPGNVRELQYTIERAVIMADEEVLQPKDLIFSPLESPLFQKMNRPN